MEAKNRAPNASEATPLDRLTSVTKEPWQNNHSGLHLTSNRFVAIPGASGVFLLSGGKILYRIRGPVRSAASAGTLAALNHSIQGPGTFTPSSPASFIHSRFCAAAVRKRALELPAACSQRDDSQVEGFHTAAYRGQTGREFSHRGSRPALYTAGSACQQ